MAASRARGTSEDGTGKARPPAKAAAAKKVAPKSAARAAATPASKRSAKKSGLPAKTVKKAAKKATRPRLPRVDEVSAGGVVLDRKATPPQVALIARLDKRGRLAWSLPKGHVEEGETPEQAAVREVREETGIKGKIVAPLGVIDFWFMAEDRRVHKTVHHFLLDAVGGELSDEDIEVDQVAWVPLSEVSRKLRYSDERKLMAIVDELLSS